jgi:hypothetical protein
VSLINLAAAALDKAKVEHYTIHGFLIERDDWNKLCDELVTATDTRCVANKLMGIPVEVLPNLMQCVERSIEMAMRFGKVGWILNPDPFSKIEMKPAFDAEGFDE